MKRLTVPMAVLVVGLASPVSGQVAYGPQLSWGDESDFGVGARVEVPFTQFVPADGSPLSTMRLIGSFDWFFPDEPDGVDVSYLELNANAVYPIVIENLRPYVGGGLNFARVSADFDSDILEDQSDTEVGLNVLGGLNFLLGSYSAFAEGRFELDGGEQFVLTFGLLFGGP